MRSRGQLWSLDVILAAVVFTLALGIILSQSELQFFYGQQDRITRELSQMAIFASNSVVSKPDIFVGNENLRCGPNTKMDSGTLVIKGWASDNELSPLENCLINKTTTFPAGTFGLPAPYALSITPTGFTGTPSAPASSDAVIRIPRRMLFFQNQNEVSASQLRTCLDGGCSEKMTTLTIGVWRP